MAEHPLAVSSALTIAVYYYVQIFHPREVTRGHQSVPGHPHHHGPIFTDGRGAWAKTLCSVGQPLLDTQHAAILGMIDSLSAALACHTDDVELERLWHGLVDCTDEHFMDEERIMQEHDFPGFAEHKMLHKHLRDRTLCLGEAVHLITGRNSLGYLKTCWSSHIRANDMEYVPYLVWDRSIVCN